MVDKPAQADLSWIVEHALRPGDVLTEGWVIWRVERLESGARFAVTTSAAPVRLIVEVPREDNVYAARTERLGIWIDSDARASEHGGLKAIADDIARRIRAFEERDETRQPASASNRTPGSKPILYLAPGHLGDPDDLSLRTLRILAFVPIIFVEHGKADEVHALLTRFDLRPAEGREAPEIVELHPRDTSGLERWRAAVAAGLDTCLFGGNEGIPGFCDPGKALVIAAADMPDAVQIRSVGGSSALGHALMRVPTHLRTFEFGGLLETRAHAQQVTSALMLGRLPLVVFSHGSAVRAHLPRIIQQGGLRTGKIHLLSAFTSDDERAFVMAVPDFVPPGPDLLPDYQAVVVVMERGSMLGVRGRWPERVIARIHRALVARMRDSEIA